MVPPTKPSQISRSSATLAPGWMPRRPPRTTMLMPSDRAQMAESAAWLRGMR